MLLSYQQSFIGSCSWFILGSRETVSVLHFILNIMNKANFIVDLKRISKHASDYLLEDGKIKKKPNVILILADDMGYGDVSALNESAGFITPNFDRMCDEGIAFTDAHATSAVCSPSRYGLLTGRYNWRSALKRGVLGGCDPALIEKGRMTIGTLFQNQGYRTAAIGKWHVGMDFENVNDDIMDHDFADYGIREGINYAGRIENAPTTRGFDYFFGTAASLDTAPYIFIENDHFYTQPDHTTDEMGISYWIGEGKDRFDPRHNKIFWRSGPVGAGFEHEQVMPALTQKALAKIEDYKDDPFFLYFPMTAPHTPILPTKEFRGKSGTNLYGDFVLMCDDVVKQVDEKLKSLGLYEDTIVIFAADNGCSTCADYEELALFGHNPSYIFRGNKCDIYEGGHRIPLIVRWPGVIPQGNKCDQLVCLCDIFATMADVLGVKLPDSAAEDSFSMLPLWQNPLETGPRPQLIHQSIDGSLSIRKGDYKLEMCPGSGGESFPYTGYQTPDMPDYQLYNLKTDIWERQNLIDKEAAVAEALKKELAAIIHKGRSTEGAPQKNNGPAFWPAIEWTKKYM